MTQSRSLAYAEGARAVDSRQLRRGWFDVDLMHKTSRLACETADELHRAVALGGTLRRRF